MSLLKRLKKSYQKENTQFIVIDKEGLIVDSDNILFVTKKKTSVSDIHPFFSTINTCEDNRFTCVHLNIENTNLICDVQVNYINTKHCLIILSDFSSHYTSFQSLAQLRNETAIASEITEIKNKLLLEKEDFKNKFIANFSHEIVNPIMSIMTFGNMLDKTNLTSEQKDYTHVINDSAYHLKNMINDVLDLSKIETNNFNIENKRFSLKKLINTIKKEYKVRCKEKGVDFKVSYGETMPNYVVSDKTKIHQILKNLLNNALKFTNEGYIAINIQQVYRRARQLTFSIAITDTGTGIAKENQAKIFERFNRLDNANEKQGSGLGLTIVKEIVSLMNGTIELESKTNKGTTFTVFIRAKTPLTGYSKKLTLSKEKQLHQNAKILLVDDDLRIQLSIFKILSKNKNFYLDISNNGEEAAKLVKKNNYDLIIIDYNMPKLNGIEASRIIKKTNQNLPIILISGSYLNNDLLKFKGTYYDHILKKPFDEEALLNSIYLCIK